MELDIEKDAAAGPSQRFRSEGPIPSQPHSRSQSQSQLGRATKGVGSRSKSDLEVFQTLVGIYFLEDGGGIVTKAGNKIKHALQVRPASVFAEIFRPSRAGDNRFRNRGLYDRAVSQDMKNRVLYAMSHYIIVSLFILQVLLSATITAIAAYHSASSIALTTLGAINTVIAGLLAWVTGQGMPVRFRRARDQYRAVVKEIEATERMFAEADHIRWPHGERPQPITERDRLEAMYEEARLDQEQNYPETQHSAQPAAVLERENKLRERADKWRVQETRE